MGHIFRLKYRDMKTGDVKESAVWWIKYHKNGKPYFESAKAKEETKAKRLLKKREGEIADGRIPGIYFDKTTYKELRDNFLIYRRQEKGAKSEKDARDRTKNLAPFFEGMKAVKITTPKVREYIKQRLEEEVITINHQGRNKRTSSSRSSIRD